MGGGAKFAATFLRTKRGSVLAVSHAMLNINTATWINAEIWYVYIATLALRVLSSVELSSNDTTRRYSPVVGLVAGEIPLENPVAVYDYPNGPAQSYWQAIHQVGVPGMSIST